ncbi:hypothetical protein BDR22DRAFT_895231 [Usnea florida]
MVHLQPSGKSGVRLSVAIIVISTCAVAVRLFVRSNIISALGVEDAFIVLALCLFWAYQALILDVILAPDSAGTLDTTQISLAQSSAFGKKIWAAEIIFVFNITAVKMSILWFYCHIFTVPAFLKRTYALGTLCVLWAIVAVFLLIFQCTPVSAAWNLELETTPGAATCLPSSLDFGLEISNVILDVLILALPVHMIRNLQMKFSKKIGIIGVFLLGGCVCVAGIMRAYYAFDPSTGEPVSSVGLLNSASLELATAILCACVPAYGPIFSHHWEVPFIKRWYRFSLSYFRGSRDTGIKSPPCSGAKFAGAHGNTSHWYHIDDGATEQPSLTGQSSRAKLSGHNLNHDFFAMLETQAQDRIEEV